MNWMEKTVFHNHLLPLARTIDNKRKWEPLVRVSRIFNKFPEVVVASLTTCVKGLDFTWRSSICQNVSPLEILCSLWSLMSFSFRGNSVFLFGKGEGLQSFHGFLIHHQPSCDCKSEVRGDFLHQPEKVERMATVTVFPGSLFSQDFVQLTFGPLAGFRAHESPIFGIMFTFNDSAFLNFSDERTESASFAVTMAISL